MSSFIQVKEEMKFEISKRHKFLIHTAILALVLVGFSRIGAANLQAFLIAGVLITIIGSYFTQRPNTNLVKTIPKVA